MQSNTPKPMIFGNIQGSESFGDLRKQYKSTFTALENSDPLATALGFSALLLNKNLQSSTYRIETLVNLALSLGRGKKRLKQRDFRKIYADMGKGTVGSQEDPAEDVFVSNISTMRGNFLALEGFGEGAGYYLDVFMQIVDCLPANERNDSLRNTVYALLTLSDKVCKRAGLSRNQLGNQSPKDKLTSNDAQRIPELANCLTFSTADLDDLGIKIDFLAEFSFDLSTRDQVLDHSQHHYELERYPLACKDGETFLLLPTAVSGCIRRFLYTILVKDFGHERFLNGLAYEYSKRLSLISFLGKLGRYRLEFTPTANTLMANVFRWVDDGRALHILFVMDDLQGFEETGFSGCNNDEVATSDAIHKYIKHAKTKAENNDQFKSGISLVIVCGVGRNFMLKSSLSELGEWNVDILSVYDFEVLSNMRDFSPISLWRLKEAERKVSDAGIELFNINGLLNLIAWREHHGGHLIPHDQIPDSFAGGGDKLIMVQQNSLRTLRQKTLKETDIHSACKIDGIWSIVRRAFYSPSEEAKSISLYADIHCNENLPTLLFEHQDTEWWAKVSCVKGSSEAIYERRKMVSIWLPRIAQSFYVLEAQHKPPKRLKIDIQFEGTMARLAKQGKPISVNELRQALSVNAQVDTALVTVEANPRFEDAFFHETNIAERELVRAVSIGVSKLAIEQLSEKQLEDMIDSIVPNSRARHAHAFPAESFRDFIHHKLPRIPVFINDEDINTVLLFLGWSVRDRKLGAIVKGKEKCTVYLNELVFFLENNIIDFLGQFEKKSVLHRLIENHEAAMCYNETLERTAASVTALDEKEGSAIAEIIKHQSRLNDVLRSTRVLVEIANCVCSLDDGDRFGEFDLAKAMAMMNEIIQLGGCSDAIHCDEMEPIIKITALGDVQMNLDFFEGIMNPYVRDGMKSDVESSIQDYGKYFLELKSNLDESEQQIAFEKNQFSNAWECELGFPIEAHVDFVSACENLGLVEEKACFVIRKSILMNRVLEFKPELESQLWKIIEELSLHPRSDWRSVPAGFCLQDRQPWKFRRMLSVFRRPIVQLNDTVDPQIYLWPGMVGDGFKYIFERYRKAEFSDNRIRSKGMKQWFATTRDKTDFNKKVADKFNEIGWCAKSDIRLTEILGRFLDTKRENIKRYGDVDVLAWHEGTRRVMVVECKDLKYGQTPGEIAEQLSNFRGVIDDKGKPDFLLKHLNRVEILRENLDAIIKITGIPIPVLEHCLVFSNPVPMGYAKESICQKVTILQFDEIDTLDLRS